MPHAFSIAAGARAAAGLAAPAGPARAVLEQTPTNKNAAIAPRGGRRTAGARGAPAGPQRPRGD